VLKLINVHINIGGLKMEVANKSFAVENILIAYHHLKDVVQHTPLQRNDYLSEKYGANIYLKREDLQSVRSFKLRGAYYKIKKIEEEARKTGVVCVSAGNHAQGVGLKMKKTCSLKLQV
jgi:threonine dehydratase